MMISVHLCVRGRLSVPLPEMWRFRCIHVWGVGFRCIYLRDDDFGAFMCEGKDSAAFTWGMTISVHSYVRGRILVHLPDYLMSDHFGTFSGPFTWRMTISVHSFVKGRIPVHLLEWWRFGCIHVWGVRFLCIYLRNDDFGAVMCEG